MMKICYFLIRKVLLFQTLNLGLDIAFHRVSNPTYYFRILFLNINNISISLSNSNRNVSKHTSQSVYSASYSQYSEAVFDKACHANPGTV